jgi:hypothetical protein
MIAVEGYSGCESCVFSARSAYLQAGLPTKIQHLIESLDQLENETVPRDTREVPNPSPKRDRLAPTHYFAKSSSDRGYCPRLLVQARKQLAFAEMLTTNRTKVVSHQRSESSSTNFPPHWAFRTVSISLIALELSERNAEATSAAAGNKRLCWTSEQLQSLVPAANSTQRAAEVLKEVEGAERAFSVTKVTLVMPFARHIEALSFLQSASTSQCRSFVNTIVAVVDTFISQSTLQSVPVGVFAEKLAAVATNIGKLSDGVLARADRDFVTDTVLPWLRTEYLSSPELTDIPVGACHGDLTLSNILVAPHDDVGPNLCRGERSPVDHALEDANEGPSLILIDFLDSFVESPLADLAKLKQDLCYCWTLRLQCQSASRKRLAAQRAELAGRTNAGRSSSSSSSTKLTPIGYYPDYDGTKLVGIFDRFWATVTARYEQRPWFKRYLPLFFLMNQLRVLQYAQDSEIATYLVATVRAEFEELKEVP